MRLVDIREQQLQVSSLGVLSTYRTTRITQLFRDNAGGLGIMPRGQGFKSIYVYEPYMVLSLNPFDTSGRNLDLLRNILCVSTVVSFDAYKQGQGLLSTNSQTDPFNVDTLLFTTKGRLEYDIRPYSNAEVQLDIRSVAPVGMQLIIRQEIYSKSDSVMTAQMIKKNINLGNQSKNAKKRA